MPPTADTIAGIFVGGSARRMGGIAKGLLLGRDRISLIENWRTLFQALSIPVVLVGAGDQYRPLHMPMLTDDPANVGPMGGLAALLRFAGSKRALAVACDMPWVTPQLLERLVTSMPSVPVLAAKSEGRWEPFFARYDATTILPFALRSIAEHRLALQQLLDVANAQELQMSSQELAELRDWDTPEDIARDLRKHDVNG